MAVAVAGLLAAATACSFMGGGKEPSPTPEGAAQAVSSASPSVTGTSVPTTPPPVPTATPNAPHLDIEGLVALLESAGVELERVEINGASLYERLPLAYFNSGTGNLAITQYPSPQFAMAEAASMRFDTQDQGVRITWTGDPPTVRTHIFVIGDLLVKYNGDDSVALDVLVSVGGRRVAGGDYGALAHGTPRITAYLEAHGHEVTIPERPRNYLGIGLFGRRGETVLVNGQELHIFDFRPTGNPPVSRIFADGYTLPGLDNEPVRMDWELPPRIYAAQSVLAIYVGDDAGVVDALRVLGGQPVRGVMEYELYPFDTEWLVNTLQSVGAEASEMRTGLGMGQIGHAAILVNGEPVYIQFEQDRPPSSSGPPILRPLGLLEQAALHEPIAHQPHEFVKDNIRALYIGENEMVLEALRAVLGWGSGGPDKMVLMGLADDLERKLAPVTAVDIYPSGSDPPEYTVKVTSEVGCDHFYGTEVERDGTQINVFVRNYVTYGACWDIFRSHTHYIFLGNDFQPGVEYTVTVNGLTYSEFQKTFVAQ
jgi:hypothetical protein